MISILWNFWKLVLWPSIWHVLEDVPCLLEKNVWAAAVGVFSRGALRSSWLICCSHLLFPYWPLFIFMGSASEVWGIIIPFCRWGNLLRIRVTEKAKIWTLAVGFRNHAFNYYLRTYSYGARSLCVLEKNHSFTLPPPPKNNCMLL